jgi:mannose-1-phosphate guanylyltransferase
VKQRNLWVVILAGGDGRRLGSLTTNADGISTPKQYCSLNGGPSLLQLSLRRALGLVARERIVPVVTEAHRRWWEPELFALRRSTVVVQPSNRGTGLGVLLPLLVIAKSDPDASVICMPSDHYVEHEDLLAESLRQATTPEALASDKLTLLGMSPNAPDSGFGYISPSPDSGVGMRPLDLKSASVIPHG